MKLQGFEYQKITEQTMQGMKDQLTVNSKPSTMNLQPGQIISGEIIQINGKEIQLGMNQNFLLHALLEREHPYYKGQMLSFEVLKNPQTAGLLLRPLFENLSKDPSLLKALEAANLDQNPTTEKMVSFLMKQGLPIDKNTLQELYKEILAVEKQGNFQLSEVLKLHQLGMPITANNLEQLSIASNFRQVMLQSIDVVSEQIVQGLQKFSESNENLSGNQMNQMNQLNQLVQLNQLNQPASFSIELQKSMLDALIRTFEAESSAEGTWNRLTQEIGNQEVALEQEFFNPEKNQAEAFATKDSSNTSLPDILTKLGISQNEWMDSIQKEDYSFVLNNLSKALEKEGFSLSKQELKELFQSDFLKQSIQGLLEKNWLLEPSKVAEKEQVSKLYETIKNQGMELLKHLDLQNDQQKPLIQSLKNLVDHVDFIHQMNQTLSYIEIPLKLTNSRTEGDLYVYTNKKNLTKKEGPITAHLSLNMEFLGRVEIGISLEGTKVQTDFVMESEELLLFMEKNMDILEKRLSQRGYTVKSSIKVEEKETAPFQELLKDDKEQVVLSQYSFDVRA